jgi:DNA-binding MarR family transcriptional regulator
MPLRNPTMNSPLAAQTLKQFRVIIGAVRHHFHTLEETCGISGAQVWILSAIADTPGITVSLLSKNLSVHVSTASNMLDKLAKAGLVERLRSQTDRRVVHLHLTAQGQAILDRAPKPLTSLIPLALSRLPEPTLTRLHEDLALLIQQMQHHDADAASQSLSTQGR